MADVTTLHTGPRAVCKDFAPDPQVIKHVEAVLEMAKSGKLRAVATAVVYHDGLVPDGETGAGYVTTPGTRYALTYAVDKLSTKLSLANHTAVAVDGI